MSITPIPFDNLRASIRGHIYLKEEDSFKDFTVIFNGNIKTNAYAVVLPVDAQDISEIVKFCTRYALSPSVKAGGYGTAGWALAGDLVIDMQLLGTLHIEAPGPDGTFTKLRDMLKSDSIPAVNGKGKEKAVVLKTLPPAPPIRKRGREEDDPLRAYDSASPAVASFLNPDTPVPSDPAGRPHLRRRLIDGEEQGSFRHVPSQSTNGHSNGGHSNGTNGNHAGHTLPSTTLPAFTDGDVVSTVTYTPSQSEPSESLTREPGHISGAADPFAYLDSNDEKDDNPPATFAQGPSHTPATTPPLAGETDTGPEVAYVTFGAGKLQKEVDIFTASHPLGPRKVPYHVPFAAHPVGSAVMMQGGFGFLSRLHGLSLDNLVEVEMVLADGSIVIVNAEEHPDLWWAVRGAGPAFGIATRYKAKAHPAPVAFAGNLIYRFNKLTAPMLLKHFRDCVKGAPRELYANVLLTAGPKGKDSLLVVQMCYLGPKEKGQEYLSALSSAGGAEEECLLNEVCEKDFLCQQDSVAQVLRGKAGRQWFIRSALISSLPDDIIGRTVLAFEDTPSGCTWLFELAGGAIADFEDSHSAFPSSQREAAFTVAALHQWEMGIDDPRCKQSAEKWIFDTLGGVSVGGPYPSFLGHSEAPERIKSCYGSNWDRLVEVKTKYDPGNLFRNCLWPLTEDSLLQDGQ